jgi:hypothetical protein
MSFYVFNYFSNLHIGQNVSMATKIRLTEYHAKACKIQQLQKHEQESEQAVPYPDTAS